MSASSTEAKKQDESNDLRFLLDGPGGAGKTTILTAMRMTAKLQYLEETINDKEETEWKQLDKEHRTERKIEKRTEVLEHLKEGGGLVKCTFDTDELADFKKAIIKNIATITRSLLKADKTHSNVVSSEAEAELLKQIDWNRPDNDPYPWLQPTASEAEAISVLWNGTGGTSKPNGFLHNICDLSSRSSAGHFLKKANLIMQKDYDLTIEDVLRSRRETKQVNYTEIDYIKGRKINVMDAGGQDSRREQNIRNKEYNKFLSQPDTKFLIVFPIGDFDVKDSFRTSLDILRDLLRDDVQAGGSVKRVYNICLNKFDLLVEKLALNASAIEEYEEKLRKENGRYPWAIWKDEAEWREDCERFYPSPSRGLCGCVSVSLNVSLTYLCQFPFYFCSGHKLLSYEETKVTYDISKCEQTEQMIKDAKADLQNGTETRDENKYLELTEGYFRFKPPKIRYNKADYPEEKSEEEAKEKWRSKQSKAESDARQAYDQAMKKAFEKVLTDSQNDRYNKFARKNYPNKVSFYKAHSQNAPQPPEKGTKEDLAAFKAKSAAFEADIAAKFAAYTTIYNKAENSDAQAAFDYFSDKINMITEISNWGLRTAQGSTFCSKLDVAGCKLEVETIRTTAVGFDEFSKILQKQICGEQLTMNALSMTGMTMERSTPNPVLSRSAVAPASELGQLDTVYKSDENVL